MESMERWRYVLVPCLKTSFPLTFTPPQPTTTSLDAYRKVGLLLDTDDQSTQYLIPEARDIRSFDDHLNAWMEGSPPPLDYTTGPSLGHQPSCGFVNYVDFCTPIQRITACLGSHKRSTGDIATHIIGLKFDLKYRSSTIIGRCSTLGSVVEFDESATILEVDIAFRKDGKASVLYEIILHPSQGISKGFREGDLLIDSCTQDYTRLSSSEARSLVGITWAFDFGFSPTGDHGIQPLYRIRSDIIPIQTLILHPNIPWNETPPPGLQLRPAPAPNDILTPLDSSLSSTDLIEDFSDTEIVSITVFFNFYLQGIKICYRNGQTRAIGNQLGVSDIVLLDQERIFAVALRERRQQIVRSQLAPGDLLCIEGIQVRK